ncbi:hypothetical protein EEL32_10355 [Brevibacillus laterosporus]|nr:hypothetical protein EEL32_10355 [Brevibacillus laterosporus]
MSKLYIAVSLMDVLLTKPADLIFGEPPSYESGKPDASIESFFWTFLVHFSKKMLDFLNRSKLKLL